MAKTPKRGNPNWKLGGPSPNPRGRGARSDAERLDASWVNPSTAFGTDLDKRKGSYLEVTQLTDEEQRTLYRGDDMAKRAIDVIPDEMFRKGFEFKHADKDLVAAVNAETKRLQYREALKRAKKFERAYGGSAIFPVLNDGASDLRVPLNEDAFSRISHFLVLEPRELRATHYDENIQSPTFNKPDRYAYWPAGGRGVVGSGVEIHRSRLIVFPGITVTNDPHQVAAQPGWGDSILQAMHEVLRDFSIGWSTAALLLVDFSQGVYTMDGLAEMISKNQGALIRKRFQQMDFAKSVIKAIVVDGKDRYERQQTPISGLADVLDRLSSRLAAAADLPVTRLMGQSPKGLGNEGDSDESFLYDKVSSAHDDTQPALEHGYRLILRQKDGPTGGKEPEGWAADFCSLWQQTEEEIATTRKLVGETDKIYFDMGALTADQIAQARFGGDAYSMELRIEAEDMPDADRAEEMSSDLRLEGEQSVTNVSSTAMTGAQVSAMLEVITAFNTNQLTKASAAAVLMCSFPLSAEQANAMLDETFTPEPIAVPALPGTEPPSDDENAA